MTTQITKKSETDTTAISELVRRARSLYSLPAVAAEVLQLTSNPQVDTRALKECIEADPALTAKILRVVNSSLFGLSREVCDLNQALALLGTKPLKLLVLGFSLPDNLFAEVAREQLDWYWSTTLTRAVAAREISEQLFRSPRRRRLSCRTSARHRRAGVAWRVERALRQFFVKRHRTTGRLAAFGSRFAWL